MTKNEELLIQLCRTMLPYVEREANRVYELARHDPAVVQVCADTNDIVHRIYHALERMEQDNG